MSAPPSACRSRCAAVTGRDLDGLQCAHPLSGRPVPVLFGDHVTDAAGTGLVHRTCMAPRLCGRPRAASRQNARSTRRVLLRRRRRGGAVTGLNVLSDGNDAVLDALRRGALLAASPMYTSLPVRLALQDTGHLPDHAAVNMGCTLAALSALDGVTMQPPSGRSRLEAFVRGRAEWRLSRQRSWGVPLPAFYDRETGEALLTDETVAHVRSLVERSGAGCWWELDEAALLPPRLQAEASRWRKGTDTLDVWFDSGASWSAVLAPREPAAPRADVYLEGSDQHRGWFQSSLLTHVGASEAARAYGAIVTHGFVVDGQGAKMSKSIGNVITPAQLIGDLIAARANGSSSGGSNSSRGQRSARERRGAKKQAARASAARGAAGGREAGALLSTSCGFGSRRLGVGRRHRWTVLMHSREAYRRLRNSCRFVLGNLHDFDASKDAVPAGELRQRDRHMLHQLAEFARAVGAATTSTRSTVSSHRRSLYQALDRLL